MTAAPHFDGLLAPPVSSPMQCRARPHHSPRLLSFGKDERDTAASLGILKVQQQSADNVPVPAQDTADTWRPRRGYGPQCIIGSAPRDTDLSGKLWYRESIHYETDHLWAMGARSARRHPRGVLPRSEGGHAEASCSPASTRRKVLQMYEQGGLSLSLSRRRIAELARALDPPRTREERRPLRGVRPTAEAPPSATVGGTTRGIPHDGGPNSARSTSTLPAAFGSRAARFDWQEGEGGSPRSAAPLQIRYAAVDRHVQSPRWAKGLRRASCSSDAPKIIRPGPPLPSTFTRPRLVETIRGYRNTHL